MIDTMFLFRSNLRIYESYHYCKTWQELKNECWDFYVNMGIWALENGRLRRFVVCRLEPKLWKGLIPICYILDNHTVFSQLFLDSFNTIVKHYYHTHPQICFWRGGFKEYDETILNGAQFYKNSFNIYCGSGRRIFPQYKGKYDLHLLEDEKDSTSKYQCSYFYKTANQNIFHNLNIKNKKYDICFPCNFSSIRYKGQEFFIREISKSKFLKSLKIAHTGNQPKIGKQLCKKYNVTNIEFLGHLDRPGVNEILNQSKFAIVCSNRQDGCPRIVTEILCSGTPLLLKNTTRLLSYYKQHGVQTFSDNNISQKIEKAFSNYKILKEDLNNNMNNLTMNTICTKNFDIWKDRMDSYKI